MLRALFCVLTGSDQLLKETCKGDTMYGRVSDDLLDANNCGGDTDFLFYAGRGSDWLLANVVATPMNVV